ncbi:hypothetical protein PILCRDRAFT_35169, partial [Piloderma croceum F 1598]
VAVQLPLQQLLHNMIMRWDTMFYMVRRLCEMCPAVDNFLALPLNRDLAKHQLTAIEWSVLSDVQVVLEIPHQVQQVMSSDSNPVLAGTIPAFEKFMTAWERLAEKHQRL